MSHNNGETGLQLLRTDSVLATFKPINPFSLLYANGYGLSCSDLEPQLDVLESILWPGHFEISDLSKY